MADLEQSQKASDSSKMKVLVYSDDSTTRSDIITAVGRRAAPGLPVIEWTETTQAELVLDAARSGEYAMMILDGETPKFGGMALGKMIHDEVDSALPFIVMVARPQDEWLSRWSGAAECVPYPVQSRELCEAVARVYRAH